MVWLVGANVSGLEPPEISANIISSVFKNLIIGKDPRNVEHIGLKCTIYPEIMDERVLLFQQLVESILQYGIF